MPATKPKVSTKPGTKKTAATVTESKEIAQSRDDNGNNDKHKASRRSVNFNRKTLEERAKFEVGAKLRKIAKDKHQVSLNKHYVYRLNRLARALGVMLVQDSDVNNRDTNRNLSTLCSKDIRSSLLIKLKDILGDVDIKSMIEYGDRAVLKFKNSKKNPGAKPASKRKGNANNDDDDDDDEHSDNDEEEIIADEDIGVGGDDSEEEDEGQDDDEEMVASEPNATNDAN